MAGIFILSALASRASILLLRYSGTSGTRPSILLLRYSGTSGTRPSILRLQCNGAKPRILLGDRILCGLISQGLSWGTKA